MKENENVNISDAGVLSILLFGVSIVMWMFALSDIGSNSELCYSIQRMNGGMVENCWNTVCLLWQVSVWYKLWLITAVTSTVTCWPCGGFLSLPMFIASFFMPIVSVKSVIVGDILVGISLSTWGFIIVLNGGIFFLWCIVMGVKEYLKEKKEVSLTT